MPDKHEHQAKPDQSEKPTANVALSSQKPEQTPREFEHQENLSPDDFNAEGKRI